MRIFASSITATILIDLSLRLWVQVERFQARVPGSHALGI
jgi:hypothetical protein